MRKASILIFLTFVFIPTIVMGIGSVDTILNAEQITSKKNNQDISIIPTGSGDVILGEYSGVLKANNGIVSASNINLSSEVTNILAITNGGTGSSTKNFVDLTSNQTIAGLKIFSDNLEISSTGALTIPVGDTSERPTPAQGMLRYNTEEESFEGYNGSEWGAIGGGGGGSAGINFVFDPSFEKGDLNPDTDASAVESYQTYTADDKLYAEFNEQYYRAAYTGLTANNTYVRDTFARTDLDGKQGLFSIWIKADADQFELCLRTDDSGFASACDDAYKLNILGDNTWRKYEIPFIYGASSVEYEIKNASYTGDVTIELDNIYIGTMPDGYIQQVGQAHFVGGIRVEQSGSNDVDCQELAQSSAPELPDYTGCDSIKELKGSISYNNTENKPSFNVPVVAGVRYKITVNDFIYKQTGSSVVTCTSYISIDGGATVNKIRVIARNDDATSYIQNQADGSYTFTAENTETINVQYLIQSSVSNQCEMGTRLSSFSLDIYAYPDSSSTIVTQDTELTAKTANVFSFSMNDAGIVSNDSYDFINGNCTRTNQSTYYRYDCPLNDIGITQRLICSPASHQGAGLYLVAQEASGSSTTNIQLTGQFSNGNTILATAADVVCHKADVDLNKSATIVGKFENINDTPLEHIEYFNNSATGIDASTNIPWITKVKDDKNQWDGDELTLDHDTCYEVDATFRTSVSNQSNFVPYINNVATSFTKIPDTSFTVQSYYFGAICANAGDKISFRITSGSFALAASSVHRLVIKENPNLSAIIKNLSNQKVECQTKYLSANATANGVLTDLSFSGLDTTKYYSYSLGASIVFSSATNCRLWAYYGAETGTNTVAAIEVTPDTGSTSDRHKSISTNQFFKPTATNLDVSFREIGSCIIEGLGHRFGTYATLCELPDTYVETNKF